MNASEIALPICVSYLGSSSRVIHLEDFWYVVQVTHGEIMLPNAIFSLYGNGLHPDLAHLHRT